MASARFVAYSEISPNKRELAKGMSSPVCSVCLVSLVRLVGLPIRPTRQTSPFRVTWRPNLSSPVSFRPRLQDNIESPSAGKNDPLKRAEFVAIVLSVFVTADRRSRRLRSLRYLCLSESCFLAQPRELLTDCQLLYFLFKSFAEFRTRQFSI